MSKKPPVLDAVGILDTPPYLKKQTTRGVQMLKWPMQKCDFNKVAYWNYKSAWTFFRKFDAYLQNTFFEENL